MILLKILGTVLIILSALSGLALYLNAVGVRAIRKTTTLAWLFIFSLTGGSLLYCLGSKSIDGIIYPSYILFFLGGISGITLFLSAFIRNDLNRKDVIWLFFLLFIPLGTIGILHKDIIVQIMCQF